MTYTIISESYLDFPVWIYASIGNSLIEQKMNKIINKNSIEESKKQKIRKFVFNPSLTKLERDFFFYKFLHS